MESDKKAVDTGGGSYISGNVNTGGGDFVGRDKVVHGDEIRGDKVQGHKAGGDMIVATVGAGAQNVAIGRNIGQMRIETAFDQLLESLKVASVDSASESIAIILKLRDEVARGHESDDFVIAELIEHFCLVAPEMSNKLLLIFALPPIAAIEGRATRYILRKLEHLR